MDFDCVKGLCLQNQLAAGWIGACVTLAVAAIVAAVAFVLGYIAFGRRARSNARTMGTGGKPFQPNPVQLHAMDSDMGASDVSLARVTSVSKKEIM